MIQIHIFNTHQNWKKVPASQGGGVKTVYINLQMVFLDFVISSPKRDTVDTKLNIEMGFSCASEAY